MAMDGHVSSSSTFQTIRKDKLDSTTWNDDLYSNIPHTKSWLNEQIKKLKMEIPILTENVKENEQAFRTVSNEVVQKLISKLPEEKRDLLVGLDVNGKHCGGGDIRIDLLEQFTGFSFDAIWLKAEKQSQRDDITLRKHHLRGTCHDIQFEITFSVEESGLEADKNGEHRTTDSHERSVAIKLPKITDLTIDINSDVANFDMREFISEVQEGKQLQLFFVTFQAYAKWKKQRLKTFHHFKEKFSEFVSFSSLRDESILAICNPKYPAVRFNIIWKILVTKEGQTVPTFDLISCIPGRLTRVDNTGLLKILRSKFCSLLKSIGIEKSIEVIINVIAK